MNVCLQVASPSVQRSMHSGRALLRICMSSSRQIFVKSSLICSQISFGLQSALSFSSLRGNSSSTTGCLSSCIALRLSARKADLICSRGCRKLAPVPYAFSPLTALYAWWTLVPKSFLNLRRAGLRLCPFRLSCKYLRCFRRWILFTPDNGNDTGWFDMSKSGFRDTIDTC